MEHRTAAAGPGRAGSPHSEVETFGREAAEEPTQLRTTIAASPAALTLTVIMSSYGGRSNVPLQHRQ